MMRVLVFVVLFFFQIGQVVPEEEITGEPSHHLREAELGGIRVFDVQIGPYEETKLHRHQRDFVSISLGDAHILDEVKGKSPVDVRLKNGEVQFRKGYFAHIIKNLSDQPFRNLTIELPETQGASATQPRSKDVGGAFRGGRIRTLFVRDGVRVSEVRLDPGATVPNHRYEGRHLVVAITDFDLRSDLEGMDPMAQKFKAGQFAWLPGGYANTGHDVAKFVLLGF